jgi:hypothetical protein
MPATATTVGRGLTVRVPIVVGLTAVEGTVVAESRGVATLLVTSPGH